MKVAIVTDTHFGVRGDNPNFHSNMRKFFEEVFFPKLEAEDINIYFCLKSLIVATSVKLLEAQFATA